MRTGIVREVKIVADRFEEARFESAVSNPSVKEPSDRFISDLRQTLLAEAELSEQISSAPVVLVQPAADELELVPSVEVNFEQPRDRRFSETASAIVRWASIAAAAALFVLGGVWIAGERVDAGQLETLSESPPASTVPRLPPEAPLVAADQTELLPGRHRVDALGTEFEFEVNESTAVLQNEEGIFQISDVSDDGDVRTITFARISHFANPVEPFSPIDSTESLWPTDDLLGWLDALSETMAVQIAGPVDFGGHSATRFLVAGSGEECVADQTCAYLATNNLQHEFTAETGDAFGVWFLDQGEEDPVIAILSSGLDDYNSWFWVADQLLFTVEFFETQPNPIGAR